MPFILPAERLSINNHQLMLPGLPADDIYAKDHPQSLPTTQASINEIAPGTLDMTGRSMPSSSTARLMPALFSVSQAVLACLVP